jgi:endonuclease/exonuclease/phosphatase family metal-dependent hydrolase
MAISVGTFNLNNLFSRFDFSGVAEDAEPGDEDTKIEERTEFDFSKPGSFVLRTYQGRLVKGKDPAKRKQIADRLKDLDLDVVAVQEVEDVDTLRRFNGDDLGGLYHHVVLIEGNDPRLIDVGVLSKRRIGAVTSWQHVPDPQAGAHQELLFSRDLLQVEILDDHGDRLLTLFVNHLKSQFVPFNEDPAVETPKNNAKRKRQAEGAVKIIARVMRPDSRFLVLGDMNDVPDAPTLAPFADSPELHLVNGLANAQENRPAPHDDPPAPQTPWTHRFKEPHKPASYELLDQIWVSPALQDDLSGAFIDRRKHRTGDGSDHDPAWVTLEL